MTRKPKPIRPAELQGVAAGPASSASTAGPAGRIVVAASAGMIAAWVAAGSVGLLAHPLRHAITWLAMAVALFAGWPERKGRSELGGVAAAVLVAVVLGVPSAPVLNVLGVALVLAVLARTAHGVDRQAMLLAALAATVLAVYRLACTSIPAVWLAADGLGQGLGRLAAAVCGKPLWVGATFAGLDFLVLMAALYAGWLGATTPPRLVRAVYAALAIAAAHLGYLIVLAHAADMAAALSVPLPPAETDFGDRYVPPPWYWSAALRTLLPWNLPAVAAMLHGLVAVAMFRWATWRPIAPEEPAAGADRPARNAPRLPLWLELGPVALAPLIPLVTQLVLGGEGLSGRTIVAYQQGYLNWDKPAPTGSGRASAGMYGMLPTLVASLGGEFRRSADLAAADLDQADLLVLIHPTDRWSEVPERLERIWEYVRSGGSLLVVAEPRVFQEDGQASSFDELLAPTAIEVRPDTAVAPTGSWQHGLETLSHPATVDADDQRNGFGLAESSSIALGWPARPLVVGRWGWSDPGSDAVLTGVSRFDAGERLGDLVLAAEQRVGKGRVVVLGDAGSLTNAASASCYEFTGRLLGYLAARTSSPQAPWRQALGLLGCLALGALLTWRAEPGRLAASVAVLGLAAALVAAAGQGSGTVLPDGRLRGANFLALIDASHLEAYRGDDWHEEGIGELKLLLMRTGYLPIQPWRLTDAQLQRAGVLFLIAPARRFSEAERKAVKDFVHRGGLLVVTAGAERAGPVNPLLADFGLAVPPCSPPGADPSPDVAPLGQLTARYHETDDREAQTSLPAAWPVEAPEEQATVLLQGPGEEPTAVAVREGKGNVVLIGDTYAAMNKCFEPSGEERDEKGPNPARFWQWLLGRFGPGPGKEAAP
jgi:hypothetical protein